MAEPNATRPPLGLPSGSIRALLTLLIVGVVCIQILNNREVKLLWTETLLIALAHYFTSRRLIKLPPDVLAKLEAEGHLPREAQPLYLPRHSVRLLLILAFAALAYHLYQENRLWKDNKLTQPALLLGVVAFYVLGMLASGVQYWWSGGKQTQGVRWWEDIKALVVLAALVGAAATEVLGGDLPSEFQNLALGLVLFYFGSR